MGRGDLAKIRWKKDRLRKKKARERRRLDTAREAAAERKRTAST
jgi:hypothetical protein